MLYLNGFGVNHDFTKAKEYFEIAANYNHSKALLNLGNLYIKGNGVNLDYIRAIEYYELSAKQNNSAALNILGNFYLNGVYVQKDYFKAKEYFELSAEQNDSNALYYLGNIYKYGLGVKQDYSKAKEYFELSAKQNNSDALLSLNRIHIDSKFLNELANLYENGYGVEQEYLKAIEYYELSASQNNSDALFKLGLFYANGTCVEKDIKKAKTYFELSANQNNENALNNLGLIHENGYGVKKDYLRAKFYYESSAKLGNKQALFLLGKLYENGRKYYEQSLSPNNPITLFKLGVFYEKGLGLDKNYVKAREFYELSSRPLNSIPLFKLGKFYEKGLGVKQDYLKARDYYELSAKKNNSYALFHLGCFYSNGEIFDINLTKAIQYLIRCYAIHNEDILFESNNSYFYETRFNKYCYRSANDIGLIYITAFQDIKKATKYIKEAAFAEFPYAQNNFGLLNELYLTDIDKAKYRYQRASENHFPLSEYNIGHILEKEDKIDESIKYFRRASEDEDMKLIFKNHKHYDKQLEISKIFIICLANLKLAEYYFNLGNYDESRKYFIKSFNKFNMSKENRSNKFHCTFDYDNLSLNMKSFIITFPLFNLENQPYLNIDQYLKKDNKKDDILKTQIKSFNSDGEVLNRNIPKYAKYNELKNEFNDLNIGNFSDSIANSGNETSTNNANVVFEDPKKLYDFITSNNAMKEIFIREIKDIICTMENILYTPPYCILFGRINVKKAEFQNIKNINSNMKDINEYFYEGFSLMI